MMRVNILARKRESGFTLIELAVTMVILFILAGFAIPVFSSWLPGHRLKSAARDVFSNLQLAKLEAIKQNQDCDVDFSAGQYTMPCLNNKTVVLGDYGNGVTYQGPGGEPSVATITFNSRGLCPINDGYVYLSNAKNSAYYRVGVPSASGVVQLQKWNGGAWE
jgi:type IV fimbrial biogenesis protein FimT